MSDYNKATNFTAKDTLPTGNSGKIVKGTEIDTEFTAIASAIASKADISSPTLLGIPSAPTASSGTNTSQIATTAFVQTTLTNNFTTGMIVMWSGTIATIPSGWYFCNGTNGTPDLRDKFVIGASADNGGVAKTNITAAYTQSGGTKDSIVVSHTHTATSTDAGHTHTQNGFGGANPGATTSATPIFGSSTTGTGYASITTTIASTGSSGTNANLPPYYALAFIMKA